MELRAYAKVNLFLRVLRKRPDGYHELDTLFERVSLYDRLKFFHAPSGTKLRITGRRLPAGRGNLIVRAAELLKKRYRIKSGVRIELDKKIPVAAGLGGGSSDAAATLLGLNRFWNLGLLRKRLLEYAAELGSDVPFFILETALARGKGRGEKLSTFRSPGRLWHVLAFPKLRVLTAEVYRAMRPQFWDKPFKGKSPSKSGPSFCVNSLERVVLPRYPVLSKIKADFILAGADAALLSGSGPTVFCLAQSKSHAESIARKMKRKHRIPFHVAHTV